MLCLAKRPECIDCLSAKMFNYVDRDSVPSNPYLYTSTSGHLKRVRLLVDLRLFSLLPLLDNPTREFLANYLPSDCNCNVPIVMCCKPHPEPFSSFSCYDPR